jgi:hypothetical protein
LLEGLLVDCGGYMFEVAHAANLIELVAEFAFQHGDTDGRSGIQLRGNSLVYQGVDIIGEVVRRKHGKAARRL